MGIFDAFIDDREGEADRRRGGRPRDHRRANTPPASPAAAPACCRARAVTCCRTRTATSSSRTRSRRGSTTRRSGPEHAWLRESGRAEYTWVDDDAALAAFQRLGREEGILPALESSHAIAHACTLAPAMPQDAILLVNLSGRGDKDVLSVQAALDGARDEPHRRDIRADRDVGTAGPRGLRDGGRSRSARRPRRSWSRWRGTAPT